MRVLRYAGQRHLEEVRRRLEPVLHAWVNEWCLSRPPVQAKLQTARHFSVPTGVTTAIAISENSVGVLWLMTTPSTWRHLLLGDVAERCPDDDLLEHLKATASSTLLRAVSIALGVTRAEIGQEEDAQHHSERGAANVVIASIELGEHAVTLVISPDVIARLPRKDARATLRPLVRRDVALTECVGRANVLLDLGSYPLTMLETLEPGEVLTSSTPISIPFELQVGDRVRVSVMLGRRGDHKAVTFVQP